MRKTTLNPGSSTNQVQERVQQSFKKKINNAEPLKQSQSTLNNDSADNNGIPQNTNDFEDI